MSEPDPSQTLPPDFLADYTAECTEHLTNVRRVLLELESAIGALPERKLLDELFHAFHSLKGLSGMVAFKEAEELAHEMESFLRSLQRSPSPLSAAGYAALADATTSLEALIAGGGASTPELRAVVEGLTGQAKARLTRFTYRPSPDLAARGVTIDGARAALQALGEITEAAPRVGEAGEISFDFALLTQADDDALAGLEALGLQRASGDSTEPAVPRSGPVGTPPPPAAALSQFVRVGVTRLDELMRLMGELVVTRSRLTDSLDALEPHVPVGLWRSTQDHTQLLERQLRELRDGVMRVRMIPIGDVFERMAFIARDLVRRQGKRVRLDVRGSATELDKFVVDRLSDPLLHLVRNAVSHGIETPEERSRRGKPEEALLALRASTAGDTAIIEVEDDGGGIDVTTVTTRARQLGLAFDPDALDDRALLDLISAPGFSTRETADRASGRGIGMAVVRRAVGEMGGTVALASEPGRGTRFTIELPLTLAITDAIIATVADRTFAVPQGSVREVMEISVDSVRRIEGAEVVAYRDRTLPLVRLARQFRLSSPPAGVLHVFVAGSAEAPVGLAVDRIVGQREIVVRPFSDSLVKVPGVAGATQLGDGRVVLILDVAALVRTPQRSLA